MVLWRAIEPSPTTLTKPPNETKILGLTCKLPVIIYRDGRIIDRDPDLPAGIEHICHPESQSANIKQESSIPIETNEVSFTQEIPSTPDKNEIDYGPAEFNEVKLGADRLVYASKRIPGHTFQFFRMGGPLKHMCKCVDCARIKKQKSKNFDKFLTRKHRSGSTNFC